VSAQWRSDEQNLLLIQFDFVSSQIHPLWLPRQTEYTEGLMGDIPTVLARDKNDWHFGKDSPDTAGQPVIPATVDLNHAPTNDFKLQIAASRTRLGGTFFF
jgi:hypothetical protein